MKHILRFLLLLVLIFSLSCESKKQDKPADVSSEPEQSVPVQEDKKAEEVIVPEPKLEKPVKKRKPGLLFLEDRIEKYPAKDKIFKDKYFAGRLKKIKGLNYELMMQNWNNETPFSREGNVIHASGCMEEDCPRGAYELFIDLKHNNINIYYFHANSMRVYTEKGWIDLPPGFKKELEIKQDLAKIGSTSDDMTSKYRLKVRE